MANLISIEKIKFNGTLKVQWSDYAVTPQSGIGFCNIVLADRNLQLNNESWGSKGLCTLKLLDSKNKVYDKIQVPMHKIASLGHYQLQMRVNFDWPWGDTSMWPGSPDYSHTWRIKAGDPDFQPGKLIAEFFGKVEDMTISSNAKADVVGPITRKHRETLNYVNTGWEGGRLGAGSGAYRLVTTFQA